MSEDNTTQCVLFPVFASLSWPSSISEREVPTAEPFASRIFCTPGIADHAPAETGRHDRLDHVPNQEKVALLDQRFERRLDYGPAPLRPHRQTRSGAACTITAAASPTASRDPLTAKLEISATTGTHCNS